MSLLGEQLLAVSSALAAIEPGPIKITHAKLVEADKLPAQAKKRMEEAVAQDKPGSSVALPEMDYEHLLELLPQPVTEARLMENVQGWPEPILANEYAQALGTAWGYLQSLFPVKVREHLTGLENVRPSAKELSRFRRALAIVEDPLSIIDRIASSELLPSEVAHLKAAYPALHDMMKTHALDALIDETARRRKKDPEWQLPRRKDLILRRLLEQPDGVAQAQNKGAVQAAYDRQREEQQAPEGLKVPDGKLPSTDAELTRQQKIDANH